MKPDCRVLLILATIVILWKIDLGYSNPIIEKQVGPFRLSDPAFTEAKLVSEFGEGYVQVEKFGNKTIRIKHIFWVPEQEVWLKVSLSHVLNEKMQRVVEAVLVTKKQLCEKDKKYIATKKLASLATSKGIEINDSINKVIEKYGEPSISKVVGKDKTFTMLDEELKLKEGVVLRYLQSRRSKEMNFAEFYFKQKKLHSFLISESE
jgi:hypothetical protein